jgi:hypothetical protein
VLCEEAENTNFNGFGLTRGWNQRTNRGWNQKSNRGEDEIEDTYQRSNQNPYIEEEQTTQ